MGDLMSLYRNGKFERLVAESYQETYDAIQRHPHYFTFLPNDFGMPTGTLTYAQHTTDNQLDIIEHIPGDQSAV